MLRRLIAVCLPAVAMLAGQAIAQTPQPMQESAMKAAGGRQFMAAELRKIYVGNTHYVMLLKNLGPGKAGAVIANYYRDERARVQKFSGGDKAESIWWLEGDIRCVEEKRISAGHLCYSVWDLGGTLYLCLQPDGDCAMSFRVVPGNPERL
jgi:hypothetical protein